MNDLAHLDQALLDAHAARNSSGLIDLYTQAADLYETRGDIDAACFYLTHAFVFALEAGTAQVDHLQNRLARYGRIEKVDHA